METKKRIKHFYDNRENWNGTSVYLETVVGKKCMIQLSCAKEIRAIFLEQKKRGNNLKDWKALKNRKEWWNCDVVEHYMWEWETNPTSSCYASPISKSAFNFYSWDQVVLITRVCGAARLKNTRLIKFSMHQMKQESETFSLEKKKRWSFAGTVDCVAGHRGHR